MPLIVSDEGRDAVCQAAGSGALPLPGVSEQLLVGCFQWRLVLLQSLGLRKSFYRTVDCETHQQVKI